MANIAFAHFVLLAIASGGLAQTFNGFGAYNFLRGAPPEEPQVVEVIRWRQPVCITSGPGVQPCTANHKYRTVQSGAKEASDKNEQADIKEPEELAKKLSEDESNLDFSSLESLEDDDAVKRSVRKPRALEQPKLYSSRVRKFVPLENMGTSSFHEPVANFTRQKRYLRLGPMMARSPPRRQTVYVNKVVDSPVTATLVASTCLPDIGIPICDHIQNSGPAYAPLGRGTQAVSYVAPADQGAYAPAPAPQTSYEPQQPDSYAPAPVPQAPPAASYEPQQPPSYAPPASSYEPQQPPSYAPPASSYEPQQPASYAPPASSYEPQQPASYVPPNNQTAYAPPASSYEPQQPPSYAPPAPSYEPQQPASYAPPAPSYEPQQPASYAPPASSYEPQQPASYVPPNNQAAYAPPASSYEPQQPASYAPPASSYEPQQPASYAPPNNQAAYAPPASSYEPQQPASYAPPNYQAAYAPPASSYEPQQPASYAPPNYQAAYAPPASYGPSTNQGGYAPPPSSAAYQPQHPVSQIPTNHQGIANYPSYQIQYQPTTTTQSPDWLQAAEQHINRPNYVYSNETPGVKPVVVVQPAPEPTLLEGINSWFMQDGNWFNVFSRPSNNQQNGGNQIVTSIVQLPAHIPGLQQYVYRPENDISDPNIINQHYPPGAGPPTEPPGIFGGLFASPSRPEGAYAQSTTTTTTQAPSILDNIFRPTNKPLVIERPDKIPIVVEKPVYVVEQPVIPGLLDIFHNPNRPTEINSTNGAEVITDPVYVLQRPPNNPPLFGLIPNDWNIFRGPSTEPNPARPTVELTENLQPAQVVVVNDHAATYHHEPAQPQPQHVVVQSHPAQPPVVHHREPYQPSAAPAVINVVPVHTVTSPAPAPAQPTNTGQEPQSHTNVTATGFIQSINSTIGWTGASLSAAVGLGQIVQTNPAKTGIDLENSETDPKTYREPNGLPEPDTEYEKEPEIVSGEVEETLVQTGVSNDSGTSDAHDRSLLTDNQKNDELEKLVLPEVEEQIGNEA